MKPPGLRPLLILILLTGLAGFDPLSYAQATNPSDQSAQAPVFRASTRLVLVDVVVTDHHGQPITGLKATDFTLLEDGKGQKINAFEAHVAQSIKPATAPIQLPPHQFTNFPVVENNGPINIVLFDLLNTGFLEQSYAKKQMIEFLRELPTGHRMALFVLGTRLRMVQGFMGNSDSLVAAGKSLLLTNSQVITGEAQRQTDDAVLNTLEANASAFGSPGDTVSQMRSALSDPVKEQENERVELTLRALVALSGAVSGYPGRKNIIWLSTNFPFRFHATDELHTRSQRDYLNAFHAVSAWLAAAQVAVYPVDIGGLSPDGVGGVSISAPAQAATGSTMGPLDTSAATRQVTQRWDTHEAMTDIAAETGGKAFYGANDFKDMMQRSLQQGENYYTLAYVPENRNWNGKYRKIEVKIPTSGTRLEYRRGYYALEVNALQGDQTLNLLASAMQPSVPEYTMVLLKVQVLPPDHEHKAVRIDYAIAPSDISFSDGPDHLKHAHLDFMATAWDKENKEAGHVVTPVDFHIRNEVYEEVQRTGIPGRQELELKPGTYVLRVGVMDRGTQRIGTVNVPLTVGNTEVAGK